MSCTEENDINRRPASAFMGDFYDFKKAVPHGIERYGLLENVGKTRLGRAMLRATRGKGLFFRFPFAAPAFKIGDAQRLGIDVALYHITVYMAQKFQLLGGFDSFGNSVRADFLASPMMDETSSCVLRRSMLRKKRRSSLMVSTSNSISRPRDE